MAAVYSVNLNINAGTTFSHNFTLTNSDMSPKNITGYKFQGRMAKHADAIDAMTSSRDKRVQKYIGFNCRVVDGMKGVYNIYIPSKVTSGIPEGKYVYSVISNDVNGQILEAVNGLVFVQKSLGAVDSDYIYDGGSANNVGNDLILDGGNSSNF